MASVRKRPNGRWEVRWFVGRRETADGKFVDDYRSASFATKTEARDFGRMKEAEKVRGTFRDPRLGRERFVDFADAWSDAMLGRPDLAPNTKRAYSQALRHRLLDWWSDREMGKVARSDVRAWVRAANARHSAHAVHTAYTVLRLIFDDAVERGVVVSSPCVKPGLPPLTQKEMTPLTGEQLDALVEAIDTHPLAVRLAGLCGLRAGEVWGLHPSSLDLLRRELHVDWHLTEIDGRHRLENYGKGRKARVVALPSELVTDLARHLETRRPPVLVPESGRDGTPTEARPHELVFVSERGGAVRHNNWYRRAYLPAVDALVDAGVIPRRVQFHDLRHTAVALWIDWGVPIEVVSAWLGHSSTTFTQRTYQRLLPSMDERAAAAVETGLAAVKAAHKAKGRDSG